MLETDYGKWIADTDRGHRKFAKTKTELYPDCLDELKLKHEQFILRYNEPDQATEMDIFDAFR